MSNEILDSLLKEYDRKKMKAENDLLLERKIYIILYHVYKKLKMN